MRMTKQQVKRFAKIGVSVAAMGVGAAFAEGETEAGISSTMATVMTYIGLGVAAGFSLMAASLAPDVGLGLTRKWIKKGAK